VCDEKNSLMKQNVSLRGNFLNFESRCSEIQDLEKVLQMYQDVRFTSGERLRG